MMSVPPGVSDDLRQAPAHLCGIWPANPAAQIRGGIRDPYPGKDDLAPSA